jgi:hypothetical protein
MFKIEELIIIHYSKNKLLMNKEIIEQYPDIAYRILADKNFPELSIRQAHDVPESASYPLRKKLSGFY